MFLSDKNILVSEINILVSDRNIFMSDRNILMSDIDILVSETSILVSDRNILMCSFWVMKVASLLSSYPLEYFSVMFSKDHFAKKSSKRNQNTEMS